MFDPLAALKADIDKIKADVERAVLIRMYREAASNALSRLATLDAENMGKYQAAIRAMGE